MIRAPYHLLAGLAVLGMCFALPIKAAERLKVSNNQRYLGFEDGRPFFYLADTAWELFHRLNREEADRYLEDRAHKGFTVIQAVALAELDGLGTPNPYGHRPLLNNDPAQADVKPGANNDYWDHVDYIVEKANSLGLFIGLLPTWGDKWTKKWGVGPEVFTTETAEVYGRWLGSRYKDKDIIWILGGDRPIENEGQRAIIRAMARGLSYGDGGAHLITFHPSGRGNSADWFHSEEWLDFNMIQSGHARPAKPNHAYMLENLARQPLKPTLDGEPCYEDHPIKGDDWNRRNQPGVLLRWFDEWDVRKAAYESMLAGACGHTYGDHNIWQMWLPGREPLSVARTPWPEALDHPGAWQMKYFRELFEARPFWRLVSNQSLIAGDNPAGEEQARAALADDGSFALVYLPTGRGFALNTAKIAGDGFKAWWFNPRQNAAQLIGQFERAGVKTFGPPTSGRNNDWLLVLDRADREFPRPGSSYQNIVPRAQDE